MNAHFISFTSSCAVHQKRRKVFINLIFEFFKYIILATFLLEEVNDYKFLNNGYITLPNVDDAAEFHNTLRSMQIMGFQEDEINCMNDNF